MTTNPRNRSPSGVKAVSYDKIGTIQRRLAWPLRKDDTHKSRMYHFFVKKVRVGSTLDGVRFNLVMFADDVGLLAESRPPKITGRRV